MKLFIPAADDEDRKLLVAACDLPPTVRKLRFHLPLRTPFSIFVAQAVPD
ncbi:MAG: hypothetical protein MR292_08040 [Alistipes sp.]|nr:hypothetical protein [Alistipes sp.]